MNEINKFRDVFINHSWKDDGKYGEIEIYLGIEEAFRQKERYWKNQNKNREKSVLISDDERKGFIHYYVHKTEDFYVTVFDQNNTYYPDNVQILASTDYIPVSWFEFESETGVVSSYPFETARKNYINDILKKTLIVNQKMDRGEKNTAIAVPLQKEYYDVISGLLFENNEEPAKIMMYGFHPGVKEVICRRMDDKKIKGDLKILMPDQHTIDVLGFNLDINALERRVKGDRFYRREEIPVNEKIIRYLDRISGSGIPENRENTVRDEGKNIYLEAVRTVNYFRTYNVPDEQIEIFSRLEGSLRRLETFVTMLGPTAVIIDEIVLLNRKLKTISEEGYFDADYSTIITEKLNFI